MRRAELHVLTDGPPGGGGDPAAFFAALVRAGADVVQLRDKRRSGADLRPIARVARESVRAAGGLLIINDDVDLARQVDADGVHLGPEDVSPEAARRVFTGLLGVSARTEERALHAVSQGASYLGVGPVYGTTSKPDAPGAIGLDAVARVAAAVPVPVIGIGGIDASNARAVVRAGAAGVAVLGAVASARNPAAAVAAIRAALDSDREVATPDSRC